MVRQALGYEKINFYGVSYGTLVGQYLAAYYPESLRSLVLDGVVTLPLDYLNHSLERFDRVLNELAESCQQDPDCAQAYPDLLDKFDQQIEEMQAEPNEIHIQYPDDLFPTKTHWMERPSIISSCVCSIMINRTPSSLTSWSRPRRTILTCLKS